jgi:hypothetical protein
MRALYGQRPHHFLIGVDIGRSRDYTVISVVEMDQYAPPGYEDPTSGRDSLQTSRY